MARPRQWASLAAVTALGFALRLYGLADQSLWMDEALSAVSAGRPFARILLDPSVDQNFPPLHNLLVHASTLVLGGGEAALRLPSVIAGTASIPLLAAVTGAWLGRRTALLSAFLLAVSPFHIWYSQEARPYALLLCLGLAAVWSAQRVVRGHTGIKSVSAFVIATAATFYVALVAAPFLVLLCGYVLVRTQPQHRRRALVGVALVALLLLPQIHQYLTYPPTVAARTGYRFDPSHIGYTLWAFSTGFSLGPSLLELRAGRAGVVPYLGVVTPILILVVGLLGWGAWRVWNTGREVFWVLAAWLAVPLGFALVGGILTSHAYNVRYAILAQPVVMIGMAAGLEALGSRPVRLVMLGLLVAMSGVAFWNYRTVPKYQREDNRAAVRYLNENAGIGDLVIVNAPYTSVTLRHYALRKDLELTPYPASGVFRREMVGHDLERLVAGRGRVWVFLSRTFHSDAGGLIPAYLDRRLQRRGDFTAAGVRVVRYRQPSLPAVSRR